MSNILTLEKWQDETKKIVTKDYHLPATVPYTQDHVIINKTIWNPRSKPEWFDVHHFGLDYDNTYIREAYDIQLISKEGDLQPQRFRQNAKKPAIMSSVVNQGKDIRERPIIIVKSRDTGKVVFQGIQDGNTFYVVGEELKFPNYMTMEFYTNSNWSNAMSVALGVYFNLLTKQNGEASEEDIENGLRKISESDEFVELLKNPNDNFEEISKRLMNYWNMMNGVKKSETVEIPNIINTIIFSDDTNKIQNINPTTKLVKDAVIKQLGKSTEQVYYSVYASYTAKILTEHLYTVRTTKVDSVDTLIGVVIYMSGSVSHDKNWWVTKAYKIITKLENYMKFHEGSEEIKKFFIAGIFQNHIGTDKKFPLGTIVSKTKIKQYYDEINA